MWSKPLPNGEIFELSETGPGNYLTYESPQLTLELSSDSITHSYQNREKLKPITDQFVEEVQNFRNLGYTIGGSIIFPSKKIDGKMTINGARVSNQIQPG